MRARRRRVDARSLGAPSAVAALVVRGCELAGQPEHVRARREQLVHHVGARTAEAHALRQRASGVRTTPT
jgi:hypothetical protein